MASVTPRFDATPVMHLPSASPLTAKHFEAIYWLSKTTKEVILGLSGGKDSVACLDLCHRYGIKVRPYFLYIVRGMAVWEEYVEQLAKAYDLGPVLYLPTPDRIYYYKYGHYCAPTPSLKLIDFRDVWEAARQHFGVRWLATGEKKIDSLERRAQLVSWGSVQPARYRAFPVAEWNHQQVKEYITARGVPLNPQYHIFGRSLRSPFEADTILTLREHFPDDYAKLCRDFPFANAAAVRAESRGHRALPLQDNQAQRDQESAVQPA
jgi:3'-phosphoadenosine 5'-phosphosulfate sulfotransferase (PAPS reductase)/FAD synthetase